MAWNNRIQATSTISFVQLSFQFQLIWVKFRIPAKLRRKLFLRSHALRKQQLCSYIHGVIIVMHGLV
jgi:hypothetical protein